MNRSGQTISDFFLNEEERELASLAAYVRTLMVRNEFLYID